MKKTWADSFTAYAALVFDAPEVTKRDPPKMFLGHLYDTLKSFCYFWALDIAPTGAVPGLFVHMFYLNIGYPKHTRTRNVRTGPKQNRRPEPRKRTNDHPSGYLGVFTLEFFGTLRLFRKIFDSTKVSPPLNYMPSSVKKCRVTSSQSFYRTKRVC